MKQKLREVHAAMAAAMEAHPKSMPLNDRGQLVPDPVPMAPPIGFRPQPSMVEIVRNQVRLASLEAQRMGEESLEQSDDFDVGDEPELRSPYELDAESEVPISVLRARAEQAQEDYLEAKREAGLRMQSDAANTPPSPPTQQSEVPAPGGGKGPPAPGGG